MTQALSPNLLAQPNNHFRKNDFEAAIWKFGADVIIEKAIVCSCQTKDNSPLPSCQNCGGIGWVFINPIQTKALISSINYETKVKEWSTENIGTVSASVRGDVERLSFMDRITIINNAVIDNKVTYSEVLTVRNNEDGDFVFCSFEPQKILAIFAFNGSTNKLHLLETDEYSIATENKNVIKFDFDFTTLPNFNGSVSVLYQMSLQYHVLDLPHDLRNSQKINSLGSEEHMVLPINCICRKANNILSLKDRNGLGILDNSLTVDPGIWS